MKDCKFLFVVPVLLLAGQLLSAQNFEYKWQRVHMDSTYESSTVYPVDSIVAEHEEQMGPLMKVVIYSNAEIEEAQPESALTNLVADMLIHAAQPYIDNDYPTMSLTNMGGIRSNFPKGAVRVYDIYSTLPFNNSVVVAVMKGKDVREILENFAHRERFEALGGVRILVEDKETHRQRGRLHQAHRHSDAGRCGGLSGGTLRIRSGVREQDRWTCNH